MIKSNFWEDYNKVKNSLNNPDNLLIHLPSILNLIKSLDNKWCKTYNEDGSIFMYNIPKCHIVIPLYDDFKSLKSKLRQ